MATALPSLRRRFLHIFLSIAAVTTLLISVGLSTDDYMYQRKTQTENMRQLASAVSRVLLLASTNRPFNQMSDYLASFNDNARLVRLCVYDADDKLVSFWQRANSGNCPALITSEGVVTDAFFVRIALPMKKSGNYIGTVYVQGELFTLTQWLLCVSKVLFSLFAIASAGCWLAARLSANSMAAPLLAMRRQIDCLKGNDITICAIPTHAMTEETAALSSSIASLRTYFDETTVPRETLANVRGWHWEVLSELLASLRHRVTADSPLIEMLNDYALLLQTIRGDIVPPPRSFNIADTLHTALASARAAQPPGKEVNLTVALSAGMHKEWFGQPEMMEALLRHLLLIGLKRTRSGFVCLRLECYIHNHIASSPRLRISLEDSGPFIQHWQLQQWLAYAHDNAPPVSMSGDISWLLSSRLFKRLDGTLAGASDKEGGLNLEGHLPLSPYIAEIPTLPIAIKIPKQIHTVAPLVLTIESDIENHAPIQRLFTEAGFQLFTVNSHLQALEWAPLMPFSAIILNASLPDATPDITRRLRHMAEDGVMPQIPLWVSTTKLSFIDFDYWRREGVAELLLKPYSVDMLRRLYTALPPQDKAFYVAHNQHLRADMVSLALSFSDMSRMLGKQLLQVYPVLQALANQQPPEDGKNQAHSVRSAALTLGYFRLAALMGQIEHASVSPRADFPTQNWGIVLDTLKSADFDAATHS